MSDHFIDNPVTRKLNQLGEQWKEFEETSNALIGVWKVNEEQVRMIEGLVYMEDSEQKVVEASVFIAFENPFDDPETYASGLIQEFQNKAANPVSKQALKGRGIDIDTLQIDEIQDTKAWLKLMSDFVQLLGEPVENFVAYLMPSYMYDNKQFVKWIEKFLHVNSSGVVKLMLREEIKHPILDDLFKKYPDYVKPLEPDIDMTNIYNEIFDEAAKGKEEEPATKFEKAMLNATMASNELNLPKAEKIANEAIKIAEEHGWYQYQTGIYIMLANGYIGLKDFDMALQRCKAARESAIKYAPENEKVSKQCQVTAIMGEAGCHLGKQDFESGAEIYAQAAPLAKDIETPHLEVEAWRMTAYCYQYVRKHKLAWEYYNKAWEAGKKMKAEERPNTTLPYVAQGLMKTRSKADINISKRDLENEIIEMLGENWQNNLAKTE